MWGIEGTVLLDESAAYARSLGIRGVPTNVIVDARGIVRAVGISSPTELRAALAPLHAPAAALLEEHLAGRGSSAEQGHARGPLASGA